MSITRAQVAVIHIARILVGSRDRSLRVDAEGVGAQSRASARARRIKRGDPTLRFAQEAVIDAARVLILSGDRSFRIEGRESGSDRGNRTRRVKAGDDA